MKKYLLMSIVPFLLLSCQEDKKAGSGDQGAPQAASQPQAPDAGQISTEPSASVPPQVSARPGFEPLRSEDVLTLRFPEVTAKPGAEVCLPLQAYDFTQLLAMQYTISWDPALLELKGVKDFGLPFLDQADFGFNRVKEGLLPFVWINDALQSTTIPDGSVIYSICFTVKGKAGQSAKVQFTERPTPFEVVNASEEIQRLQPSEGRVVIE